MELRSHRSSSHSKPGVRANEERGAQAPRRVINEIAHHNHDSIGTAATTHHPVKLKATRTFGVANAGQGPSEYSGAEGARCRIKQYRVVMFVRRCSNLALHPAGLC